MKRILTPTTTVICLSSSGAEASVKLAVLLLALILSPQAHAGCFSIADRVESLKRPTEPFLPNGRGFTLGKGKCFSGKEVAVDLGLGAMEPAKAGMTFSDIDSQILGDNELALKCPAVVARVNALRLPLKNASSILEYEREEGEEENDSASVTFTFANGRLLTKEQKFAAAERGENFCEISVSIDKKAQKAGFVETRASNNISVSHSGGGISFYSDDENSRTGKIHEKFGYQYDSILGVNTTGLGEFNQAEINCSYPTKGVNLEDRDGLENPMTMTEIAQHIAYEGKPLIVGLFTNYGNWKQGNKSVPKKILSQRPDDLTKDPFCKK